MPRLKAEAERVIAAVTPPSCKIYFTDGSVDPIAHCRHRLCSKGCHKILEGNRQWLIAPGRSSCDHGSLSPSAIDRLQHSIPNDIYLLTSVLTIVQRILAQGRRIIKN